MTRYSLRALINKFEKGKDSWIRWCDNDCGALVYYDVETRTVRNAVASEHDSLHKDTCTQLKKTFQRAASLNWHPSYSFEKEALLFIEAAKKQYEEAKRLLSVAELLETSLSNRHSINAQAKIDWDAEKAVRRMEKEQTDEWKEREIEMLTQWQEIQQQERQRSTDAVWR